MRLLERIELLRSIWSDQRQSVVVNLGVANTGFVASGVEAQDARCFVGSLDPNQAGAEIQCKKDIWFFV